MGFAGDQAADEFCLSASDRCVDREDSRDLVAEVGLCNKSDKDGMVPQKIAG